MTAGVVAAFPSLGALQEAVCVRKAAGGLVAPADGSP
jgi:hypothetical protein